VGAPSLSPSEPCFAWTKATSFLLSALEKEAASTIALRALTRFCVLGASTCAKEAGFLAIPAG
jgi:hypothetical protein